MMRALLTSFVLLCGVAQVGCQTAGSANGPKAFNTTCPVGGETINAGFTKVHEGTVVGFCCDKCAAKFDKGTEEQKDEMVTKAAANVKAVNQMCPLGGDPVDPQTASLKRVYKGQTIAFCCDGCTAEYDGRNDKGKAEVAAKALTDAYRAK